MGLFDKVTGATIEKALTQYSEVYGEILLGMDRDMERHQTLIKEHDQNMRQGVARVIGVEAELKRRFDELSQAVTQAEAHSKNASRFSEQAKSAALAAGGSAKESKEELEKTQRKWQALLSMVETQREEIRTLGLTFKRFRTRVMWASAAVALVVIGGGLAWIVHFMR